MSIPEGFKLVPVEPTEEMIYAIATGAHRGDSGKEIWSEALAYAADIDWPKIAMEAGLQYVREPDDHYVTATPEKMADLLRDVIGIDIRRPSGCGYNESKRPQPIYDEAKDRELFCVFAESVNLSSEPMHVNLPFVFRDPIADYLWAGWKACAQSRAKSVEVGGVMVTLAALCLATGIDMHAAGETELARIWTKVEQIRAKQAAKPAMSPLPGVYPDREQPAPVAVVVPERREIGPNYPYLSDLDIEWNACLDELKRLNPSL